MTKHRTRITLAFAALGAAGALATITPAPPAHADTQNCRIDRWGLFGFDRRLLCDTPVRQDGSWDRHRIVFTPAHYVPITTSCSSWSCTSWGGFWVDLTVSNDERYVVTPETKLPDEPDHLDTGGTIV